MKPQTFILFLLVLIGVACKKDKKTPIENANPEKLQLSQVIYRNMRNGQVNATLYDLDYDAQGRLVKYFDVTNQVPVYEYEYEGDLLKTIREYDAQGQIVQTFDDPMWQSPDGDTIELTTRRVVNGGEELQIETFVFHDSLQVAYQYFGRNPDPIFPPVQYTTRYTYDFGENISEINWDIQTNRQIARAFDDKLNFGRTLSRLNYILLRYEIPSFNYRSRNNVTAFEHINSVGSVTRFDMEYTYNRQGYPITMKMSNENFIRNEYIYEIED